MFGQLVGWGVDTKTSGHISMILDRKRGRGPGKNPLNLEKGINPGIVFPLELRATHVTFVHGNLSWYPD